MSNLMDTLIQKFKYAYSSENEFILVNIICTIIFIVGFCAASAILLITGFQGQLFDLNFCFTNKCVELFYEQASTAISVSKATGALILGIFAFGSFNIACKNYISSKKASNSNIHISNVSVFLKYVGEEINKRDKLQHSTFDLLKWYNAIYPDSQEGQLKISDKYIDILKEISNLIQKSNSLFISPTSKEFKYTEHQVEAIKHYQRIGITLHIMPRLDFYEVESQIINLIETINTSFCYIDNDKSFIPDRQYR